jgi:hypothetical protein
MSEIKKGDLVMVVRWPCCGIFVGRVFTVIAMHYHANLTCDNCGSRTENETVAESNLADGNCVHAHVSWLKKIEPPTDQMRREEGLINKVEA